ncbi:hypothetical protein HC766_00775 [Candidatus Gracilibacteria bacterium]|nr:hypothetical protein [Candidatus Gracilibacteria bacterium]NJS40918.1 hypothetical protein [Candidatus Gracilibacteria bacterium]
MKGLLIGSAAILAFLASPALAGGQTVIQGASNSATNSNLTLNKINVYSAPTLNQNSSATALGYQNSNAEAKGLGLGFSSAKFGKSAGVGVGLGLASSSNKQVQVPVSVNSGTIVAPVKTVTVNTSVISNHQSNSNVAVVKD